jgi:hypothetical protein
LSGGDAGGLRDLLGIGKTLTGQRIAAEQAPPPLLQIEPARPGGNEDLMEAWMLCEPAARLGAVVAREFSGNDVDVAGRIVGFTVGEQGDVALWRCAKWQSGSPPYHRARGGLHRPTFFLARARSPWGL